MKNISHKKGFTLIEMSLAVLFISIILVSAAVIINNIVVIYQKGLSMRAVNTTGRELVDEFTRSISAANINPLVKDYCGDHYTGAAYTNCKNNNARHFVYQQTYKTIPVNGTDKNVPVHGVFCTGRHSYIWNTGYALNLPNGSPFIATYPGYNNTNNRFRLLKVPDSNRSVCSNRMEASGYGYTDRTDYTTSGVGEAQEILESSDDDLAIYDLVIFKPVQQKITLHTFISGTFILATKNGSVDITGTGEFCKEKPEGLTTDFAYCAVNKFNFAMNAKGEKTE